MVIPLLIRSRDDEVATDLQKKIFEMTLAVSI